ncbi:MAG: hypothetical protein L3K25_15575 [Gammaproteobacteria bacterium]|nr:hypothetical protein [Gammaproteobacteria bacterium]
MDIISRQDDRSYVLIANFIDGYAAGWKMALPESFKDALDIKLTPRTLSGKTLKFWTQGRIYDFHEGDVIYNTKLAYDNWDEALKSTFLGIQITSVTSSGYVDTEVVRTKTNELTIFKSKGKSVPKEEIINELIVKKQRLEYGIVKFTVLRVNSDKTAVKESESVSCNQEDFVVFLQTGIVRTKKNELLDLFNIKA